jgi:hypothetical protein
LPTYVESDNSSDKSFSFYIRNTPEESYITFPGYDESVLNGGSFTTHSVVEEKYFSLNLVSVQQEGKEAIDASKYKAVIDSGTSIIMGDRSIISELTDGFRVKLTCEGLDELPNISFTIDETTYTLTPEDYVVQITDMGVTECMNGIRGTSFPTGFNYLILGDVFMRKYYTYFNMNDNTVGFYEL